MADASAHTRVAAFSGVTAYDDAAAVARLVDHALEALHLPASFVEPGDRVVLKPNWVKEHDERTPGPGAWEHVVTHPAVIEAVIRWVAPRLAGHGSITVCDAPQTDSSFARLRRYCALDAMVDRCRRAFPGLRIELLDLRPEEWHAVDGVTVSTTRLPGDPLGSTHVRLDEASELVGYHGCGRLYGASYDMAETNARHTGTRHEYLLCRTPMDADVLINLPKLKTHKKTGLTGALKNLVGINANKNWLPHHTEGTPATGGDQFPAATTRARLEHSVDGGCQAGPEGQSGAVAAVRPGEEGGSAVLRRHPDPWCARATGTATTPAGAWCSISTSACSPSTAPAGAVHRPLRYLAVVDGIVAGEGERADGSRRQGRAGW